MLNIFLALWLAFVCPAQHTNSGTTVTTYADTTTGDNGNPPPPPPPPPH